MEVVYRESLINRYIFNLNFDIKTPLHVGYGQDGIISRIATAYVNGSRRHLIPSSSFKGILRSLSSKLAKSYVKTTGFKDTIVNKVVLNHYKDRHLPKSGEDVYDKEYGLKIDDVVKYLLNIYEKDAVEEYRKSKREDILYEIYLSLKCPICRLFGSQNISSKIILSDGVIDGKYEIDYYRGVSIDRSTKTSVERHLYAIERIVPEDAKVVFKMIVDNLTKDEEIILCLLLKYLSMVGVNVGGGKSRGYGKLTLDSKNSSYIYIDFSGVEKSIQAVDKLLLKKRDFEGSIESYLKKRCT